MKSASIAPETGEILAFGPFRFDLANGLLYRDGAEVPLPPRALAVLQHLAGRPNQVVSKQALMDAVWKDTYVEEASLKEAISRLREALGDDPQQARYIQTVHRRGYRFLAAPPDNVVPLVPSSPAVRAVPAAAGTGRLAVRPGWPMAAALIGVAGLVAAAATWFIHRSPTALPPQRLQFSVALPQGYRVPADAPSAVAVSPDGRRIAIAATREGGQGLMLFVRDLDTLETRPLNGTEGATGPFFSPDGSAIGFYAFGKLRRVPATGGAPADICQVIGDFMGADWGVRGEVVFGSTLGVKRVPAVGGTPALLTHVDNRQGETGHWWPHFLPDGSHLLFTAWTNALDRARIDVVSIADGQRATVMAGASDARYADGHLIAATPGGPAVIPFDVATRHVAGEPVPLGLPVLSNPFYGVMELSASTAGALAYVPGSSATPESRVMLLDPHGGVAPSVIPARPFRNIAVSPDGHRIAVTMSAPSSYDVWVGDLDRGTLTRLTTAGRNIEPVWSPDGAWIAFAQSVTTPYAVVRRHPDGSGGIETIFSGAFEAEPSSWSPDGRVLLFERFDPESGFDLWTIPLEGARKPAPFIHTRFQEMGGRFSPDGRWVVYQSDESGTSEIYVCRYPTAGEHWQVSTGGGEVPFWSRDGRTIYYSTGDLLTAVTFASGATPTIGRPQAVRNSGGVDWRGSAPDGRVVGVEERPSDSASQVNVAIGWPFRQAK